VFVSYAHADENLRIALGKQLAVYERQGLLEIWHDRMIPAGAEWDGIIRSELDSADLVLFLVSADFLASSYCWDKEVTLALERGGRGEASVVPIIIKPCPWIEAPFGYLQALPTDGKPVSEWRSRAKALAEVARAVSDTARSRVAAGKAEPEPAGQPFAHRIWNLPRRNRLFSGRAAPLASLEALLAESTVAITGLGGVGKSQIALEYAYQHVDEYSLLWWVHADDAAAITADYVALAQALDLAEKDAQDHRIVIATVSHWLDRRDGWLLVFDNARHSRELEPFLPKRSSGRLLITSRNPLWGELAATLPLDVWEREESVDFLRRRVDDADGEAAARLANGLGDLPLALEQVAAYLERTRLPLADYVRIVERELAAGLSRDVFDPESKVAATWEMSLRGVAAESAAAAQLLDLCAFFAADGIPLATIQQHRSGLPEPLRTAAGDLLAFNDAVAALLRFSLAERQGDALSLHRLVQKVTRDRLGAEGRRQWAERASFMLHAVLPDPFRRSAGFDPESARVYDRLAPHAVASAGHAHAAGVGSSNAAWMLLLVGDYRQMRGDLTAAGGLYRRSLAAFRRVAQAVPSNPVGQRDLAVAYDRVGDVLQTQERLENALTAYRKGLEIRQRLVATDPANVDWQRGLAVSHDRIGEVLQAQGGQRARAMASFRRALEVRQRLVEADPDNAIVQRDLSVSYEKLGSILVAGKRYDRAFAACQKGLDIRTELAAAKPSDAIRQRDLFSAHTRLGRVAEEQHRDTTAQDHYGRGLAIIRRLTELDPSNAGWQRDLFVSLVGIGGIVERRGDRDAAADHYREGLEIIERLTKLDSTNTVWSKDLTWVRERIAGLAGDAETDAPLQ
jgi:tetratricopeptide (TPR) repeat protein